MTPSDTINKENTNMSSSNAALALRPPVGCRITPRPEVEREGGIKSSTLAALAQLEPCADDEVDLPAPCLLLTAAEQAVIEAKAQAWREACEAHIAADQALAAAQTLARQVSALRQKCGVVAAQGFSGKKVDALSVQKATADLAEAEAAASAVPVLVSERDMAKEAASAAWGSLRGNAQVAMRNALMRQSAEMLRLGRELARIVGHMAAAVDLLNDPDVTATMAYVMVDLKVPAPPLIADWRGVEAHRFRNSLAEAGHTAVVAHTTAARGWLTSQLHDATGMAAHSLMMK